MAKPKIVTDLQSMQATNCRKMIFEMSKNPNGGYGDLKRSKKTLSL
jgi:hypothetical protein